MPAVIIPNSPNLVSLDSKIVVTLCDGNFLVDTSPTVYKSGGSSTSGGVQGASVRITNPVGVIIDNYPTSGFDIYPPMTSVHSFAIPMIAGVYQYGTYTIDVRMTDHDGTNYTVTKSVNICPPDPKNKNRNYGCMNVDIRGNCQTGKVIFLTQNPPVYKATEFTSQVNDLTVEYPTASGLPEFDTTLGSFSLNLYEGQYLVTGYVCALYDYGDYVYFYVNYKVNCSKIIKCIIDECCVFAKLQELQLKLTTTDCTQGEKDVTFAIITESISLLKIAELAASCGQDPSDTISDLEKLLGCICTCNCNDGVAIIGTNTDAGIDFVYRGILTQSSTSAPTAQIDVTNNTVEIAWTRTGVGQYIGTLTGTFTPLTANNTFIITGSSITSGAQVDAGYNGASSISVKTTNAAGSSADGLLGNTAIELSIFG